MSGAGIMKHLASATVDVRDMLCAQALAVANSTLRRLTPGQALEVLCNAADVKGDLLAWAQQCGHAAVESGEDAQAIRLMIWRAPAKGVGRREGYS